MDIPLLLACDMKLDFQKTNISTNPIKTRLLYRPCLSESYPILILSLSITITFGRNVMLGDLYLFRKDIAFETCTSAGKGRTNDITQTSDIDSSNWLFKFSETSHTLYPLLQADTIPILRAL